MWEFPKIRIFPRNIAGAGSTSRGDLVRIDNLPLVNMWDPTETHVWGALEEDCNSTCHSTTWIVCKAGRLLDARESCCSMNIKPQRLNPQPTTWNRSPPNTGPPRHDPPAPSQELQLRASVLGCSWTSSTSFRRPCNTDLSVLGSVFRVPYSKARKLEHHCPHSLKVKYRRFQH